MANEEIVLKVEGMTCSNCAMGLSKSLKKIGIKDVDASFLDGEVSFEKVKDSDLKEATRQIESLGYKVASAEANEPAGKWSAIEKKFYFTLLFTVPLFLHMFAPEDWWINNPIVQIALCTPVFIVGVMHFGKSAWGSIKAGIANMDVLIFIGSTSAFAYSLFGTISHWGTPEMHQYMFFETAATIITLVLLGNVLEHRSVQETTKNIGNLSKMQATSAKIVMRVGEKEKIFEADANTVKVGDEIQVNEGDIIPVDGVVISGKAFANEATITGESEPIEKEKESQVFSGTILTNGNLRILTQKIAKESTLQQIIELVKKARKDQPNIQKLGDKVSGIFVPTVLGISALTFILAFWAFDIGLTKSLMNAVAVLVISCPCAMGLATPTAVVAGVGRAAKKGILIKGGSTLEKFAQTQTIIFDKTGTLTSGQFDMTVNTNELGERLLPIVLSLESNSSHPIAQSLTRSLGHIEAEDLKDIKELKGKGMEGISARGEVFFFGKNTDPGKDYDLQLTLNGKQVATLNIEDEILPNAKDMVQFFASQGLKTVILSGDRAKKVSKVATILGIKEYHSGMSPQSKLDFISNLAANENIAMVGDGINDGPALSLAQVGISAKGASALAVDSAKIAIMGSKEMEGIMQSYLVSKHTYRTIKQNLFWAFAYNIVAIPIAAFGFLNPMVAALAMAFSDVIVIGNSLRLKVKKLK